MILAASPVDLVENVVTLSPRISFNSEGDASVNRELPSMHIAALIPFAFNFDRAPVTL